MQSSKYRFLSVILPLFLISCEMEVMLELEEMPRSIVIDAIIHSDSVFMSRLSTTVPLTGRSLPNTLEGANAAIINERGLRYPMQLSTQTLLSQYDLRYYKTQETDRPQPGKSYSIQVTKDGLRPASAQFTMPEKVRFSKVKFSAGDFILVPAPTENFDNYRFIPITVTFQDLPGDNYYEIEVFTVRKEVAGIDPNPDNPPYIFSDEDRYDVLKTFSFNPLTNSREFDAAQLRENAVLLFRDSEFKNQSIEFDILAQYFGPANTLKQLNDALSIEVEVVVALRHVTREYFLYKTSLDKYFSVEGNPFAEPVNVFTNIENGLGIFTGFAQSSSRINPRNDGDYR